MNPQYEDMSKLYRERLSELVKDMQWRCQEAKLEQHEFLQITTMSMLTIVAAGCVYGTKSKADKHFVDLFQKILKNVRKIK